MDRKLCSGPRLPLKETNENIPQPVFKKARLNGSSSKPTSSASAITAINTKGTKGTISTKSTKSALHTTITTSTSINPGAQTVANGPSMAPETTVIASIASKRQPLSPVKQNIPNQRQIGGPKLHHQLGTSNVPTATAQNTQSTQSTQNHSNHSVKTSTLVGEELLQWQQEWRKIMRVSTVYFDTQGFDQGSVQQQQEQKRAARALRSVGCHIARFYDREVTIIVSRRTYDPERRYVHNDIFYDAQTQKIKVWNYDKVFRFLKNIGVPEQSFHQNQTGELYNLLREEKIFGTNDRDPNARRDDLHYLGKNYLYVYDPTQELRPIAVREWADNSAPTLHLTLDGKCPFIDDGGLGNDLERRKLRRRQKFEAAKVYRETLKLATMRVMSIYNKKKRVREVVKDGEDGIIESKNATTKKKEITKFEEEDDAADIEETEGDVTVEILLNSLERSNKKDREEEGSQEEIADSHDDNAINGAENSSDLDRTVENVSDSKDSCNGSTDQETASFVPPPPPVLMRQSSVMQPEASKYYDFAASGFNGASNAQLCSMDSSLNSAAAAGNGLGPTVSQVPSKNINNLKRRIFLKKKQQKQQGQNTKSYNEDEKESRPGYCENCRVKYDHFDDHVFSNRHRNFACDDSNFKDIDELIGTLRASRWSGLIASNGESL